MVTPQQAAFEKYRERQQKRAGSRNPLDAIEEIGGKQKRTPLGLDPVEGEPVDLTQFVGADGEFAPPSESEIKAANDDFMKMARGEEPTGFGDGLDDLLGDDESATRA